MLMRVGDRVHGVPPKTGGKCVRAGDGEKRQALRAHASGKDRAFLVLLCFRTAAPDPAVNLQDAYIYPPWRAAWRQRELLAISSPEFRKALEANHIILIGWREIKKLL